MPYSTLQVPPPLALCPFLRLQPDQISFSSFNPLCSLSPLGHRTCCSAVLSAWNTLLPPSQSRSYSSFSSQLTRHFLWEAFRDLPGWAECLSSLPTIPYSSPTTELSTLVRKFLITGSSPLPSVPREQGQYLTLCFTPPPPRAHIGRWQTCSKYMLTEDE